MVMNFYYKGSCRIKQILKLEKERKKKKKKKKKFNAVLEKNKKSCDRCSLVQHPRVR